MVSMKFPLPSPYLSGPCEEMAEYRALVSTTMCVPPEQERWSGPGEDGEDHRGEDRTELPDREVASLCEPPSARKRV